MTKSQNQIFFLRYQIVLYVTQQQKNVYASVCSYQYSFPNSIKAYLLVPTTTRDDKLKWSVNYLRFFHHTVCCAYTHRVLTEMLCLFSTAKRRQRLWSCSVNKCTEITRASPFPDTKIIYYYEYYISNAQSRRQCYALTSSDCRIQYQIIFRMTWEFH